MSLTILPCPVCGSDEGSTYIGAPGPGVVRCFAVGCEAVVGGYPTDEKAIKAWNVLSLAMDAAMAEAYCQNDDSDDDLTECFRHHIRTTIGWLPFAQRPSPEVQMYEEGFKAGYRRCKSDNEPEFGEDDLEPSPSPASDSTRVAALEEAERILWLISGRSSTDRLCRENGLPTGPSQILARTWLEKYSSRIGPGALQFADQKGDSHGFE